MNVLCIAMTNGNDRKTVVSLHHQHPHYIITSCVTRFRSRLLGILSFFSFDLLVSRTQRFYMRRREGDRVRTVPIYNCTQDKEQMAFFSVFAHRNAIAFILKSYSLDFFNQIKYLMVNVQYHTSTRTIGGERLNPATPPRAHVRVVDISVSVPLDFRARAREVQVFCVVTNVRRLRCVLSEELCSSTCFGRFRLERLFRKLWLFLGILLVGGRGKVN